MVAVAALALSSRAVWPRLSHARHKASAATATIYVLVTAGAVLRVLASLRLIDYNLGIEIAGTAWGAAFLLFAIAYRPVLWQPRIGEKR